MAAIDLTGKSPGARIRYLWDNRFVSHDFPPVYDFINVSPEDAAGVIEEIRDHPELFKLLVEVIAGYPSTEDSEGRISF